MLIRRGFYAIKGFRVQWRLSGQGALPGESGVWKLGFESHVAIPSLPCSGDRSYLESSKG